MMVQMEENQWEKVQELFEEKRKKIKELEEEIQKQKEIKDLHIRENDRLIREIKNNDCYKENKKLKKENLELNASLSLVLEKLNESLNIIEKYSIESKKPKKVTLNDLRGEYNG